MEHLLDFSKQSISVNHSHFNKDVRYIYVNIATGGTEHKFLCFKMQVN